ncbi:MAG: ArsB/NhaD family transporter [Chloroflexota bacterium]
MATLIALAVFAATTSLVLFRPLGLPEGVGAAIGAALTILFRLVTPRQAGQVAAGTLNILGFFLGMMAISAIADQAGLFEWAARLAARSARGSGRKLLLALFLIGSLVTVFLSNDATALVLTPLVLALVKRLGLRPLAYVYACTFVANAASTFLPISNPLNIIMLTSFPSSLPDFVRYLAVPTVVAVAGCYLLFGWVFRRDLAASFDVQLADQPAVEPACRPHFRFVAWSLAGVVLAYLAASFIQAPLAIVAVAGGTFLLAGSLALGRLNGRRLARDISWSIFPFVVGMFIVIQGLENAGLTAHLAAVILAMGRQNLLAGALGTTFLVALASNLVNNLPVAVLMISALHQAPAPTPLLFYGTLLGADLGPCLSVTGSLAGMLWLIILRRGGLNLTGWQYLRLGAVVTPVLLLASGVALWAMLAV